MTTSNGRFGNSPNLGGKAAGSKISPAVVGQIQQGRYPTVMETSGITDRAVLRIASLAGPNGGISAINSTPTNKGRARGSKP